MKTNDSLHRKCFLSRIKLSIIALLATIAAGSTSCHDFFERDIENDQVMIKVPANGLSSSVYLQRFSWVEVNGAREYHLRLVTPSFGKIAQEILDTTVSTSNFAITLPPNKYELSIAAQNAGYKTKETVVSFEITESYDLSIQEINIKRPANLMASNSSIINFGWDILPNASSYTFEIFDATGKSLGGSIDLTTNSFSISAATPTIGLLAEQTYTWRIYAKNEISKSKAATASFTIDRTPPAALKSLIPNASDTSLSANVSFSWTKVSDTGTAISDSIYISSDQSFASLLKKAATATTNYSYSFPNTIATYYWKIVQTDAAGNRTESDTRKLLISPQ